MSRHWPYEITDERSGEPTPGAVLEFAQAVRGESLPGDRDCRTQAAKADRQLLEWLAEISTEHERLLRNRLLEEAIADGTLELGEPRFAWPEHMAEEWDESKHPRDGGPPNPGWFASTGGSDTPSTSATSNQPREQDRLAQAQFPGQPPAQGGQQGPAPGNDGYPNQFGTWPNRPAGQAPQAIRGNGMGWLRKGQVTGAYNALPQPTQAMLHNNRVELSLDRDDSTVRARDPKMKKDAIGAYDSGTGTIHIFDTRRIPGGAVAHNQGLNHALRHEVGHAADHHLSNMSQTPGFMQAYQADVNAAQNHAPLSNADKHYLSKSKEAFAEAFARNLEGGKSPGVLPNSVKYMQRSREVQQLLGPSGLDGSF